MNGRLLLDTNLVIALLNGEQTASERTNASDTYYLSATIVGELYYGAYNSIQIERNIASITRFLADAVTLNCDSGTAKIYGEIKSQLRRTGKPLPENDIWIAAIAFQYSLILATRDKHFTNVVGLQVEFW